MPDLIDIILPLTLDQRALVLALALMADAVIGEPDWLWSRLPHPVVGFGRAISAASSWGNRRRYSGRRRRINGMLVITALVMLAFGVGGMIAGLAGLAPVIISAVAEGVIVTVLVAGRSLDDHVRRVAVALRAGDMTAARFHVSMIVGRNPDALDAAAMARASIETTAENLSDGVVAPGLFYLLFGLPGIIIYKMINTADSMIGYKSKDHFAFGTGAARLDDLVNLIPARITGFAIALAAPLKTPAAVVAMARDAGWHRSPNAGWPEAAMAAVLGLALAGPRQYGQRMSADREMNPAGRRAATADDVRAGLVIMWRAIGILVAGLLVAGMLSAGLV
ncbi:MAG: cobalamin biosynthesis protein CobD [Alphaproteobacteria bacterium]|nr:cobalamin biosynthesis protein CobD [Alphaproteobacteria bacterium]